MTKLLHLYAFGSICRGEISDGSDVDLLAVTSGGANELSRSTFSIYSHEKIRQIWREGNPFAWHLHLESRLIYSSDNQDFVHSLGCPAIYAHARDDCERFQAIFTKAAASAQKDHDSVVFDLSAAFLGLRNFASCLLLGRGSPNFSRGVALTLMADPAPVSIETYRILERARLLCTRGHGQVISGGEIQKAIEGLPKLEDWMSGLIEGITNG